MCDNEHLTAGESLRRLREIARRQGVTYSFVARKGKGKGSHGKVCFGSRPTIVKDRKKEVGAGLLHRICNDLGIKPEDL